MGDADAQMCGTEYNAKMPNVFFHDKHRHLVLISFFSKISSNIAKPYDINREFIIKSRLV